MITIMISTNTIWGPAFHTGSCIMHNGPRCCSDWPYLGGYGAIMPIKHCNTWSVTGPKQTGETQLFSLLPHTYTAAATGVEVSPVPPAWTCSRKWQWREINNHSLRTKLSRASNQNHHFHSNFQYFSRLTNYVRRKTERLIDKWTLWKEVFLGRN